jgi:GT2 family glycosyltransferase
MRESITVAIVTRNRAKDLHECLISLSSQTHVPSSVLIINNNSTDSTHHVIQEFSGKLHICEVIEKTPGYPNVYNRALEEARTPWVAFIDDDCVADPVWFEQIVKMIHRYPHAAAIMGNSENYYKNNPYACAFQFSNVWWRKQSTNNEIVTDFRSLDSRNIVYNKRVLQKYHIRFDTAFIHGAEDSDLGMQLYKENLLAFYVQNFQVLHKEPTTWKQYATKKNQYFVSQQQLDKKWGNFLVRSGYAASIRAISSTLESVTRTMPLGLKMYTVCIVLFDMISVKIRNTIHI